MSPVKKQQERRPRKVPTRGRPTSSRRPAAAGSRVGDDLVEAFEQMAAHLRGDIRLEDVTPLTRQPIAKQTTPSS
jgi:hypothetical protein